MGKSKIDMLLAGAVLALAVAAPVLAAAAPGRSEAAAPIPTPAPARESRPAAAPQTPDDAGIKSTLQKIFTDSDTQIAERLRALVTAKQTERRFDHAGEYRAVAKFYAARNYAPLWSKDGQIDARAKEVTARLKDAAADGLDPADYPAPNFTGDAEALARDDLKLTHSMLTYARHLAVGRIAPTRVLAEVDYGDHTPEPADILREVTRAADAGAALERFNPPHEGFRALKAKLAELRSSAPRAEAVDNRIADGHPIRPGAKDARVPELRERLHLRGNSGDLTYDRALYNAVRRLQQHHGLKPTGVIDRQTIAAINGPRPMSRTRRSTASAPIWSVGAGCRAIWARPM